MTFFFSSFLRAFITEQQSDELRNEDANEWVSPFPISALKESHCMAKVSGMSSSFWRKIFQIIFAFIHLLALRIHRSLYFLPGISPDAAQSLFYKLDLSLAFCHSFTRSLAPSSLLLLLAPPSLLCSAASTALVSSLFGELIEKWTIWFSIPWQFCTIVRCGRNSAIHLP